MHSCFFFLLQVQNKMLVSGIFICTSVMSSLKGLSCDGMIYHQYREQHTNASSREVVKKAEITELS